jgi:hypothetical protein
MSATLNPTENTTVGKRSDASTRFMATPPALGPQTTTQVSTQMFL